MMKLFCVILSLVILSACSSPGPLTGNPDDASATPGTTGSSKMTEQMPRSPVVERRSESDTAVMRRDSVPRQQP